MAAYGNVLFSIFCDDVFYKKGLEDILEKLYVSFAPRNKSVRPVRDDNASTFFLADIVVLSSKSIFERMPARDFYHDSEDEGMVIVFCSKNMSHIIQGVRGYDKALFLPHNASIQELTAVFYQIMFGTEYNRRGLFKKKKLVCLTNTERRISELLKKGLNQQQIASVVGINAKTVSSHLRSAMAKLQVKNMIEYRVKIQHMYSIE